MTTPNNKAAPKSKKTWTAPQLRKITDPAEIEKINAALAKKGK